MMLINLFVFFPATANAFDYSTYNSLCPITIYPCTSDSTFPSYTTVECTKKAGEIYKTDRCTIVKFYKNSAGDDVCKVKYPVSGGTKTAYAKTSRFIQNKSFAPIRMTAAAKTNVSSYAGSSTTSGWYISSGDKFYVLGRSGSNSQVAYPVSGGYKVAWIKHYDIKFNANGGSNAPSAQVKTQNVNLTLTGSKPKRTGYTFQNWNTAKNGSGTNYAASGTYKANSAATLYAQWKINTYKLTVNSSNTSMGTVSGGGTYNYGKSVTIKATPKTGHSFVKWNDGNTLTSRNVTINSSAIYTASFKVNSFAITVNSENTTMGTVSGGGTYNYGNSITIKATPKKGYHFVKWSDNSTLASRSVTVSGAKTYTAYFEADKYTITVNSENTTMGTVSGGGTYPYNSKRKITANPNSGYKFVKWSDGSTSSLRDITVTGNATYTAIFEADPNTCSHTYGSWEIDQYATCVEQGKRHRKCTKCGLVQNDILELITHQFNDSWTVRTPATCETDGEQYRKCIVCNTFTETKTIEKLGHDFSEWKISKSPTCTEDGIKYVFCKNCNICNFDATETIPATGHSFPDIWSIDKEATCTEEGVHHRECTVCAYKQTETIEILEHDYKESRYEPNNSQAGQIIRRCTKCGNTETEYFYNEINGGIIEMDSLYAKAGDTISMPIKITDNPGILGFNFKIRYNSDVITPEPVSVSEVDGIIEHQYATKGDVLAGGTIKKVMLYN